MGEQQSKMASAPVIVNATTKHTASVIFLHGLGDTGHGWASSLGSIALPHIKFICPTAPIIPVTLNAGFRMPSWFDLKALDMTGPEDEAGIKKARDQIHQLIDEEAKTGIPHNRIAIGGFSQGGALALFSSLTKERSLAGVVALSCWLPLRNQFPHGIVGNKNTATLMCHGEIDPVVPFKYGELTADLLKQFMPKIVFKSYKGLVHSSCDEEMKDIKDFLMQILPPV